MFPKFRFKRLWGEAEIMPIGYGYAWRDYKFDHNKVLFPIPFNWIFRFAREFWFFMMGRILKIIDDNRYNKIYEKGYKDGYHKHKQISG